jgi:hypothetical protein
MSVSCECCVLSGRRLCDELVIPTVVCLKSVIVKPRKMMRPRTPRGCRAIGKKMPLGKGKGKAIPLQAWTGP